MISLAVDTRAMPGSNDMMRSRNLHASAGVLACVWMAIVALVGASVNAEEVSGQLSAQTRARAVVNFSTLAGNKLVAGQAPAGQVSGGSSVASRARQAQAVGTRTRSPASPPAVDSFLGLPDNLKFNPPDTHGAVGTNYLMSVGNGSVRIQTRTGAVVSSTTLENFWSSVFTNNIIDVFDPKVLYDETRDRFIFTACYAGFDTNSAVLIGTTATGDPTGTWFLYRVQADAAGQVWADYPSIGFNSRWVVVSMNMFDFTGTFVRANVYIFDKANLYAGGAAANNTLDANPNPQRSTLAPVVNHDDTGAMFLIQNSTGADRNNNGVLSLYSITGRVGFETVNPQGNVIVPGGWEDFPIVGSSDFMPQLGTAVRIQGNDSRMQNALLRNGSLWCAHHVFLPLGIGTRAAVQWFQIIPFGGGFVLQRGQIDDPGGRRFFGFPSIAVNRKNDALVGYSSFGTNQYASANYSFRLATDPPNRMQADQLLKAGEGPYFKTRRNENRWGDYSMTVTDPLNGIDMWTIQEFAATPFGNPNTPDSGRWGTWWGRVAGPTAADGVLELTVTPAPGSVLQGGSQIAIQVAVTDTVPVTNAVVRGTFGALTNVIFPNDGLAPDAAAGDHISTINVTVPNLLSNTVDLVLQVSAPGKADATLTVTYLVQAPPPNDDFVNGIRIPDGGGIVTGNNTFATFEAPGEPLHAGVADATNSVWWYWSPTNTGTVLVDTLGTAFNNVVAVYFGNNVSNLVQLAASDDTPTPNGVRRQPFLYFSATNGSTYRIAIAGASSADFGPISLRLRPDGIPDTNAPVVTVTSPQSGLVTTNSFLTLTGTAFDPPDVNGDSSGIAAVLVTLNQSLPITAFGTTNWTNSLVLNRGTNVIHVVAVDNAQNVSRPVTIAVNYLVLDAPHDLFVNAQVLTNSPGSNTVATVNGAATKEVGEPDHAGKVGGKSVWFSFLSATDGVLDFDTAGSDFDTLMAIYTGDRVFRAVLVSSNDNAGPGVTYSQLSQPVRSNVTYHIAVDGLDGASGLVRLNYSFTAAPVVAVTIAGPTNGLVTPPGNLYLANSQTQFLAVADASYDFVMWQGSVDSLANPLRLTLVSNIVLTPIFLPHDFSDGFESGNLSRLPWTNGGTPSWTVQLADTNDLANVGRRFVARSGVIGSGAVSSLVLTNAFRDGLATFDYRVSSEPLGDFFIFLIDGVEQTKLSGETGWQRFTFAMTAGLHRLEWRYSKDGSFAGNLDAVFLDNVDLPVVVPKTASTPALLSRLDTTSGNPVFRIRGQTNQAYVIQASTDLFNWQTLGTNIAVHGFILVQDPEGATNYNVRYYRALVP